MHRKIDGWHSPSLNRHMEIAVYGHYGAALLMFPTAGADYLEYERFLMLDAIQQPIESGKFKAFSVNSLNSETWLKKHEHPRWKSILHQTYNDYIINEVVPYIKSQTSADTPIYTTGASLGALHAANMFFRRPDIFAGCIAMSGNYDLSTYTDGYWDQDVYFNSPMQYLQNLGDHHQLENMRRGKILIMTGSGNYETPDASRAFSALLHSKGIPHELDVWGHDMPHDWPTWRAMLPYVLQEKF